MQRAVLNRATMRVADTTEVSGRVTAESIKHGLSAKKQSSLWRLTIFGFCKVCSLVAATLILPALAYAQNNQGDDQGNGRPGVPNGTYVVTGSGYVPGQVPIGEAGRQTFIPNATGSGGTTSGVASYSVGGTVYLGVTFAGTFTVNADGSVSVTSTSSLGETVQSILYPTPDGNTIAFVQTGAHFGGGPNIPTTINGVLTRGR
jgi:hypothetical protein